MSKSTITRTSTNKTRTSKENAESKKQENSSLRKSVFTENASTSLVNSKSKPSVKLKDSLLSKTNNTYRVKGDLEKAGMKDKLKPNSQQSTIKKSIKPITKLNTSTTITKSSLLSSNTNVAKQIKKPAPTSPPTRVTKTQYFPSKDLYSKLVKEQLDVKPTALKWTKVDSNKPTQLDELHENSETERPRTATLKRGSIVNSNIAGPVILLSDTPSLTLSDLSLDQEIKDDSYEDDFDSYESDFEAYSSSNSTLSSDNNVIDCETSSSDETPLEPNLQKQTLLMGTDDERMLDSGNYDLPENKHKQILDNINESNEQDGTLNKSNMASLSDEGFEEGKSFNSANRQFLNFADAQKKWKQNKHQARRKKRGEEILNMIRLDYYMFTLIEMAPIPYDVFMKSFGKSNTLQISTQTRDDDICEETQTELIETTNKWIQFPIVFSKVDPDNPNYLELYRKEFLGVGDDDYSINSTSHFKSDQVNYKRLNRFLAFSSQIVITLMNEMSHHTIVDQVQQNKTEIPFSQGYIKYDLKVHNLLKNRPIIFVSCNSVKNLEMLTVHGKPSGKDILEDDLRLKSIICKWNMVDLQNPEKIFVVAGDLCFCTFLLKLTHLLFGGLHDGSIAVWNINENGGRIETGDKFNYNLQIPIYVTGIADGHFSKVVSIQSLVGTSNEFVNNNLTWKSANDEICSLEENGVVIIWSVIEKKRNLVNHTAAPLNQLSLVKNQTLSLKEFNIDLADLLCKDMNVSSLDPHHLYISTNYGYIIHCLASGARANPKRFKPLILSQANCLEPCPFSPLYFFVGYENGIVVLYSRLLEKPLMTMSNKDDNLQSGVELLQWSHHKPCMFYAKDRHNTIHVWDLSFSDLYPIYSIPFKENVTCMKLVSSGASTDCTSYMVIVMQSGLIYLHVLKPEYGSSNVSNYQQDVTKFLNYVNRL